MNFEAPTKLTRANALVHGMGGAGKTRFSITARPLGNLLHLDIEGGTMSIMEEISTGLIQSMRIEQYAQFVTVMKELKMGGHGFETLVVDSGTELQKLYLDMIVEKDIPTLQDYGKLSNETRKSLRFLRDLDINLIYICLSKDEKDEQFGSMVRKPSLTGKLPEEAAGYLDLVLYITTKEVDGKLERVAVTQPTERLVAKDRSGKLERYEKPDFALIHGKIFGDVAQAKAKPAKDKGGKKA
jgi:hypothetical protein